MSNGPVKLFSILLFLTLRFRLIPIFSAYFVKNMYRVGVVLKSTVDEGLPTGSGPPAFEPNERDRGILYTLVNEIVRYSSK